MLGKSKIVMQAAMPRRFCSQGLAAQRLAKTSTKAASTRRLLGGHPNLNGVWQVLNTANCGPRAAFGRDQPRPASACWAPSSPTPPASAWWKAESIPYMPEAKALKDKNAANAPGHDPEAMCYLPGIPRATYINLPFQIVQGDKGDILMVYEYASANRVIHMKETLPMWRFRRSTPGWARPPVRGKAIR